MNRSIPLARIVFGAWMLANGVNHFFLHLWQAPTGHEPLAIQLMAALVHSGLLDVAMLIQLVAGALILAGLLVPVSLCALMPVSTCALYWALVLERQPAGALLALVAFALNGLLMLAYLNYYQGALQRRALAVGESTAPGRFYENLFVDLNGRTSRSRFVPALLTLVAVVLFYALIVKGRTAQWCLLVLLFPAFILHARRLHDMGHTAWLLLLPVTLLAGTLAIRLQLVSPGADLQSVVPTAALVVSAAAALWGCFGRGQAAANRFGAPVSA
jgi:uncharacterized membrane protein YhaH (DUF805 family)